MSDLYNKTQLRYQNGIQKKERISRQPFFLSLQNKWRQILKSVITFIGSNFAINWKTEHLGILTFVRLRIFNEIWLSFKNFYIKIVYKDSICINKTLWFQYTKFLIILFLNHVIAVCIKRYIHENHEILFFANFTTFYDLLPERSQGLCLHVI